MSDGQTWNVGMDRLTEATRAVTSAQRNLTAAQTHQQKMWTCPRCQEKMPFRYVHGAIACESEFGVLALGMDRPVHKCCDLPRWAEIALMQQIAEVVQRSMRREPRHAGVRMAYGPVVVVHHVFDQPIPLLEYGDEIKDFDLTPMAEPEDYLRCRSAVSSIRR